MATKYYTGVLGTATITGTGNYTGIANVTGYRNWSAVTDGDVVEATVKSAAGTFENVLLTKSGGATPVLARTTILDQTDGTTNAVSWPTNTQVEIYSSAGGKTIANIRAENVYLANQHLSTKRLTFDESQTTYLVSDTDEEVRLYIGSSYATRFFKESDKPTIRVHWADSGSSAGPDVDLYRNSSSPAINDNMGRLRFLGKNSSDVLKVYARISGILADPAAGAEDGQINFTTLYNGSEVDAIRTKGVDVFILPSPPATGGVLIGKSTSGFNTNGTEIGTNGIVYITASAVEPLQINRRTSDGRVIAVARDGTTVGGITVASGVVSVEGACMTHPSAWAADPGDLGDLFRGLVVCSAEPLLADESGAHPYCRLSDEPGDPAVYGVIQGYTDWTLTDGTQITALSIAAVGAGLIRVRGPVRIGDLLEQSAWRGVAQAQSHRRLEAGTVAKARGTAPDDGRTHLIPCTLMAG